MAQRFEGLERFDFDSDAIRITMESNQHFNRFELQDITFKRGVLATSK
jgi:hypothetical protein